MAVRYRVRTVASALGFRRLLAGAALLAGIGVGASAWGAATATPGAPPPGVVFALLADNRLVAARTDGGAAVAAQALAPPPAAPTFRFFGHYLALGRDGRTLFPLVPAAPVPGAPTEPSRLVVLDAATASPRTSFGLPADASYRGLAVGPATGRLYLFGTRADAAIVTVIDPATGAVAADWTAKAPVGPDFRLYRGAVAADERRLFVSYYGDPATGPGIDVVDVAPDGLRRCPAPAGPRGACLPGFAGFEPYRGGFLTTTPDETGSGEILELDGAGAVARRLDLRLGPGFLMDFAVDARAGRLYGVGSCGYLGGLSVVDLRTGQARVLVPPDPPMTVVKTIPCGQRLALGPGGVLVVGKVGRLLPASGDPGALLFLDAATGRVLRSVATPSEPVDVLVVRPQNG